MSARRGLVQMLGGNAGAFAIQFAGSVAIAHLLSPPEMGVYAASMALVWIINGVLNVGLMGYVVRERELPREKLGTVFTLTAAQSAIFGVTLLLGAPLVGWFANDDRVTQSVRLLAWFGALMPVFMILQGLMQRRMRFERVVYITLVNVGVSAIVTIALAASGFSWRSMPIGSGVGVTCAVLLGAIFQRAEMVPFSRACLRPILQYGARMMGAGLIMNFTNRVPDLVLTRFAGAGATGLYNRGANLVDNFNNSLMRSFARVLATQMARDRDTPAGIGPVYAHMSRLITGLFWPAFALLAVLAGPIVTFLFGARWLAAAPVLAVIAVGGAINMTIACRAEVLVTSGREGQLWKNEAVRGVIGLLAFSAAAYWGGLTWAAWTRVLDSGVAVALYSPGIHAATGLTWASMARAFGRSALVAATTAAPALIAMALLGWPKSLPAIELFGLLALSGAVWLASLFATRHELAAEATRAFGQLRSRLPRHA